MIIEEFRNIKIAYVRRTGAYGSENQKLIVEATLLPANEILSAVEDFWNE